MGDADRLDDGEAQARADLAPVGRDPEETVKDQRQAVGIDADAGILDRQYRSVARLHDIDHDPAAGRRVFDRIVQQVDENLLQPVQGRPPPPHGRRSAPRS